MSEVKFIASIKGPSNLLPETWEITAALHAAMDKKAEELAEENRQTRSVTISSEVRRYDT
jgi:hypothetical protein